MSVKLADVIVCGSRALSDWSDEIHCVLCVLKPLLTNQQWKSGWWAADGIIGRGTACWEVRQECGVPVVVLHFCDYTNDGSVRMVWSGTCDDVPPLEMVLKVRRSLNALVADCKIRIYNFDKKVQPYIDAAAATTANNTSRPSWMLSMQK